MTERTCETCAWCGDVSMEFPALSTRKVCRFNPPAYDQETADGMFPTVQKDDWCRHWSHTTGWDRFEEMPTQLEVAAYDFFVSYWEENKEPVVSMPKAVEVWLEEFRRGC